MTNYVLVGVSAAFSLMVSVVVFLIKQSIFVKLNEFALVIQVLEKDHKEFQTKVLEDYALKADIRENNTSHKELWTELNSIKERIVRLEK